MMTYPTVYLSFILVLFILRVLYIYEEYALCGKRQAFVNWLCYICLWMKEMEGARDNFFKVTPLNRLLLTCTPSACHYTG